MTAQPLPSQPSLSPAAPVALPAREDFRCIERLRVRWAEVDPQNIVFNAHYLMYLDTASAGYWRSLAMPYAETLQSLGGDLFVRRATVEYAAPAHYDEQLEVGLRCASIGRSSLRFLAGVFRAGRLLVSGELIYVYAHPVERVSLAVPTVLREAIESYEAGAPAAVVSHGPWVEFGAEARSLRQRVLVEELGLATTEVDDGHDDAGLHLLARNRFGLAVATARLQALPTGGMRLSRLAVHPLLRGSGIGRALVRAGADAALQRGERMLRAEVPAVCRGFFERQGFTAPAAGDAASAREMVRVSAAG